MATINFRAATQSDIVFLTKCAEAAYSRYVTAIGQKPAPMVYDFESRIGLETIDLIKCDGKQAGYMVWRFTANTLFLDSIAVMPPMEGKGLARAAFDYLEAKAKQEKKTAIELYTNAKMSGNLKLYPHLGFVEIDRRKENGFERIYFQKQLS